MEKPESALTLAGLRSLPDMLSKQNHVLTTKKQRYEKLFVKGIL
jgi:hypothetical protein